MKDPAALKQVVAELFETNPDAIHAGFSLRHQRFQSSAGRGVLAAAIHRTLGVYCPKVFTATQYGELEAAIFGTVSASAPPAVTGNQTSLARPVESPSAVVGLPGVRVGVDVEMVESMPDVPDFWSAPFYRSHFTPAEIAYCLRQEQPRMHFAARWCAKEALAKCDPVFASMDPTRVQVSMGADGRPVLERVVDGAGSYPMDFAISMSHTPVMAIAVVAAAVNGDAGPPKPPRPAGTPAEQA